MHRRDRTRLDAGIVRVAEAATHSLAGMKLGQLLRRCLSGLVFRRCLFGGLLVVGVRLIWKGLN
jgi:uncharacterized membrane protein YfcA